jgi:putative oxidoreductase
MKIVATVVRYLMGLMFLIFGLNGFLHFIPQPPPTDPLALQYMTVMITSHYLVLVFLLQFVGGVLLLLNRFVPLALVLLAPIIVNILEFHILMNPGTIAPGLLALICWLILFFQVRPAFAGIFQAKTSA